MEQTLITPEERRWRRSHAIAVLAVICFYMLCPVAPRRWADAYESYGKILIISVSAIYFYKRGLRGAIEVKLVIFYAIWLFITRLLNTDLYLQNELDLVLSRILCAVVFPVGLLLNAKDRARLLDWFSAIVGGFYVIVAVLGLYAYLTDTFFTIPPEDAVFGINFPYYFCYLVLLGTSRTISSVWLYIGWCLMAYQFFRHRGWLWRIPIGTAWALFHISISVAYCRSIIIIVGINAAMLAVLWLIKALRGKKSSLVVLLSALAIVITMPLVYKSFALISDGLISLSAKVATEENSASDMFIETYSGSADDAYVDPRSFSDTAASGSPRWQIYASFFPTLKEDPMRILIGKYSDKIMQIPHKYMDYTYFHMHNYLLQTFMLTGIVGFLIVLAFSVLLVRRTVMLFFSKHPDATLAIKSLTLPITGFFVYAMFEILMFTGSADERSLTTDIRELSFFLLAGIVLGYAYELAPDKKKNR